MKLLITSVRNEAPYLAEWIAWHKMLGFDHFLIYTNDNTDNTKEILEKISRLGFLTWFELFPEADKSPQMVAFNEAVKWLHEHQPEWAALFDVDEFLNLKQDASLDDFLNRFPDADAIAINWKIFGSSHLTEKGIGLTPERFLWSAHEDYFEHRQFKSIFRYNKDLIRIHHRAIYKSHVYEKLKYTYPNGVPLNKKIIQPGPFNLVDGKYYFDFSVAQLNHYAIRSLSEFKKKRMRGNGLTPVSIDSSIKARDDRYLKQFDKNDVFDISILTRLDNHVDQYLDLCTQADMPTFIK